MLENFTASQSIGLEPGLNTLSGVFLKRTKDGFKIETAENVKQLYTENFTQDSEEPLIVYIIPTSDVLQRPLSIKLKKKSDIDAAIPFLAEPHLPYPVDEAIIQKWFIEKEEEGSFYNLFAVRKERMKYHLDQCHLLSIDPETVTTTAVALASFTQTLIPSQQNFLLLHLNSAETSLFLFKNGNPIAAQSAKPLLENDFENRFPEINRMFLSLSKQVEDSEQLPLLMTGEGAVQDTLVEKIRLILNRPFLNTDLSTEQIRFAAGIGAGLTGLNGYKGQNINFRKDEFRPENPLKRLRKPTIYYLVLTLSLAVCFLLFSKIFLSYKENLLRENYVELLASLNKSYPAFEKAYLEKIGQSHESIPTPNSLTIDDISNRLEALETEIRSVPDIFPLQPNTPTVSDLLAWLSNLPVVRNSLEGDKVSLENLSYTMVKRPDQTKKNEKYKVRVELEFSTPTPKASREFHDTLIAPNDFIDSKEEIKWSSSRGKSKTSFFLKDRTVYRTN